MRRHLATILLIAVGTCSFGAERMDSLPTPNYHPKDSDPAWLSYAAQFHGHLGPWAAAGGRAGISGRRAVGAEGYFDLQITCEGPLAGPPRSCFLDGLQVTTGATLGKRNLHWVEKAALRVVVKNARSGQQVEIRPTARLMELLTSFQPRPKVRADAGDQDHDHDADDQTRLLESIARKIATLPETEIFHIKLLDP